MNIKDGILIRLDIGEIIAILKKLSPANKHEEVIAEKLKFCLALGIFGKVEPE